MPLDDFDRFQISHLSIAAISRDGAATPPERMGDRCASRDTYRPSRSRDPVESRTASRPGSLTIPRGFRRRSHAV
jgi:hypothetical protein